MDGDYIKTLSEEEKLIFIKLFCRMMKADNVIAPSEISFLNTIAVRYGVTKDKIVEIIKSLGSMDYIAEARKISNRNHALELIKELCVLANIDEDLNDTELDIIVDVADAMGIESEKVILINRWVLDSLILNKAGNVIMEKTHG